jgi:hypothetical protein
MAMPAPYPQEFREGAIALVREGRSIPDVARAGRLAAVVAATGSSRTSSIAVSATMA